MEEGIMLWARACLSFIGLVGRRGGGVKVGVCNCG